jgi:hypothetical protein
MAKNKGSFEGQELAPMETWRPEYAPQAVSSRRNPLSAIVAFVVAAGFGLSIGGAFASQAGILPPLGGTDAAVVADQSPDASVDPMVDADVDATTDVDVDTAPEANGAADPTDAPEANGAADPTDAPAVNPDPTSGPVVIPPPAGGGTGDEDDGDDDGEGEDDGGEND